MLEELKERVCLANKLLKEHDLIIYNFGNVSGIDLDSGLVAIKPSGIDYDELTVENIVIVDLDGNRIEGGLNPSSDTPSHLELYRAFKGIGGVCHTHARYSTMWAQGQKEIPCLGTTHADYFYGPVPVTDNMTAEEIITDYELNTGKVIVRRFQDLDPNQTPAVLVAGHGPFTWGPSPEKAVENAVVLEEVARMALGTVTINPDQKPIAGELLDKHYLRKHGKDAYYGQKEV
jgi:L-ribulose-5-phosphate 4-epimerase